MANMCYVGMAVRGEVANIERLTKMLQQKDGEYFIGRGMWFGSENIDIDIDAENERAEFYGDVKWSVRSALIDNAIEMRNNPSSWYWGEDGMPGKPITLVEASKILELQIELFSEEGGIGFMEHELIDKGKVIFDNTVDWIEYFFDEYETREEAEDECEITITDYEWSEGTASRGGHNWEFMI